MEEAFCHVKIQLDPYRWHGTLLHQIALKLSAREMQVAPMFRWKLCDRRATAIREGRSTLALW